MTGKIAPSLQELAVSLDGLTLDPANARTHPSRNLEAIKGSLARYGQQKPIVIDDDNVVVAGNGTVEAARALGWTHLAAVKTDLDSVGKIGFSIADNRTAELAEWDTETFAQLESVLRDAEHELVGWTEEDLERLGFFDVDEADAPALADGDRAPFQQVTFTLHDEQAEVVKDAISKAQQAGYSTSSMSENSNGNALAHVCEVFCRG